MVGAATTVVGAVLGIGLIILVFWLFFAIMGILGLIFWIFMIVDVVQRKFKNENDKIVWVLVVILAGVIGALIYYFVIAKENKR